MAFHSSSANSNSSTRKPIVVGLYGIPGSGKSFLLNQLKGKIGQDFEYYDGSGTISSVVPGGLDAFQRMDEDEKKLWRERAIDKIKENCSDSGRVGIVAGHLMFWDENNETGKSVWTLHDQTTYTHIFYLDVPAETIARQRENDSQRARPAISVDHLDRWLKSERDQLRELCLEHGILFSTVPPLKVSMLLRDIQRHTEEYNLSCSKHRLDQIFQEASHQEAPGTMLVMDADRTLTSEDTGELFWNASANVETSTYPLKAVFSSNSFGYSYEAFRQVTLLYEEVEEHDFNSICDRVTSKVTIHPEFVKLLRQAAERHVGAVVITCGVRLIWEKILEKEGLSQTVKVIGGGRIKDGFVVTGEVKRALVARLKYVHDSYVCAFGDSKLDLPMLQEADRAIVVVGAEGNRSRSMDAALSKAIADEHLRGARQVLLPSSASPRLDTTRLPLIDISEYHSVACHCSHPIVGTSRGQRRVLHATKKAAGKLLQTPMRDKRLAGPVLQKAHQDVGWYLAKSFLPELIGLETYEVPHVQGHQTNGHRIRHEKKTSIVALMRGGEPMARGVYDALPLATFVHAKHPNEVKLHDVQGQETVILVDAVVNSGKSVAEFVGHIRTLNSTICIVVVAGVIQAGALSEGSFAQILSTDVNFGVVALRLSDNKFTGSGTTDTGNRLFNTTHLQ